MKFVEIEEKDNNDITLFVDPPYIRSAETSYAKHFKLDDYTNFISYIKESKYNIAYTDIKSEDLDWKYLTLRKTMINTSPTTNKFKNIVYR